MKPAYAALPLCMALAVIATGSRYVTLPGYAFRTNPDCHRTVSKDAFDKKCDWPKRGIKAFSQPLAIPFT